MEIAASFRPTIQDVPLTVVLPLVAPATIEEVVGRWQPVFAQLSAGSQLLVVDDQRVWPDDADPHAGFPFRIAHHPVPLGVGGCLESGLRLTDTRLVLAVHDDGSFDPLECLKLLPAIDAVDIVVACRDVGPTPWPLRLYERLRSWLASILIGYTPDERPGWPGGGGWKRRWIARRTFGVGNADPTSGMFLARTEVLRQLPVQSSSSFAWIELLAKANHLSCVLTDVAITSSRPAALDVGFAADARRVFSHPDFGPPRRD
jgi:hypothetical protein